MSGLLHLGVTPRPQAAPPFLPKERLTEKSPDQGDLTGVEGLVTMAMRNRPALVAIVRMRRLAIGPKGRLGKQVITHSANGPAGLVVYIGHPLEHRFDAGIIVLVRSKDGRANGEMAGKVLVKDTRAQNANMNERVLRRRKMAASPKGVAESRCRLKVPFVPLQVVEELERPVPGALEFFRQEFALVHPDSSLPHDDTVASILK
jgi:hypothetical protein